MKQLCDIGEQTGKVRKARKPGTCQDCRQNIVAGDTYVVGSQMDYQHGPHAHKRLCLVCAKTYDNIPNLPSSLMEAAAREFFIGGYDPIGQHHTPDDLAFSMLHELDLLAEGEENELNTPAKISKARAFIAKWKGLK